MKFLNAKKTTLSLAAISLIGAASVTTFANNANARAANTPERRAEDNVNTNAAYSKYNSKVGAARDMDKISRDDSTVSQFNVNSKSDVQEVQEALADKGLNPGPIDGRLGPQTTDAIKSFQRQNNLAITGRLDSPTLNQPGADVADWRWTDTNMYSE